jgi:Sodium/hydrogen exchanger family
MLLILFVSVVGKLFGCGLAALASGMDWVRSLRIGFGMISRGEVGLIVTAMGASTGIFGQAEVAVMVAVVLLTTILTPIALRGAFQLKSPQDLEEGLVDPKAKGRASQEEDVSAGEVVEQADPVEEPPGQTSLRLGRRHGPSMLTLSGSEIPTDLD